MSDLLNAPKPDTRYRSRFFGGSSSSDSSSDAGSVKTNSTTASIFSDFKPGGLEKRLFGVESTDRPKCGMSPMSGNEILRILYSHTTINQKSRPDHKGIEHSIDSMMQTYVKKKGRGVIPPINIVPTGVFEDGSTQYTSFNNRRLTALKKVLVNMSAQEIASFKVMVNVLNPDSDASYNIQGYTEGATNLDMIKYRTGGNTLGYSNIPTLRQPSDQKEEKKDS